MFTFIKNIFKKKSSPESKTDVVNNERTIKDLEFFDDVWIEEDGVIYRGWIWEISRRCITVVYKYGMKDFRFQIPRPLTLTKIEQDNKILYCNEPKDKMEES